MYVKELELEGLELVDPNADYRGTQTIFIDFNGANDVLFYNTYTQNKDNYAILNPHELRL